MTLQNLLLKLSNNKGISVKCDCYDGKCKVTIEESYWGNTLLSIEIDLTQKIDTSPFDRYLHK